MIKNRVHISKPELVYNDEELGFTLDGSCCTMRRDDGTIDFWTGGDVKNNITCMRFHGTAEDPFAEKLPPAKFDYNNYRSDFPCGIWVQSFYKCDDGMLIGFTHREDYTRGTPEALDYPQNYHIGFSVSHDGGQSWKYLGDACGTICNYISKKRSGGKFPNIGGVPFFAGKDGYFYFYYNEYNENYERYVSGARLPIKEAVEMIKRNECPAELVKKYSGNGVWDTDAMFGVGVRMFPEDSGDIKYMPECGYMLDCHSDAAYCSALDKYVLCLQSARQLVLFFSDDGANWDEHIVAATAEPYTGLFYYSTIVGLDDEASDDFSTVGHDFYIYYTHKVNFLRLPDNYGDYFTDMYYRCRVTIK